MLLTIRVTCRVFFQAARVPANGVVKNEWQMNQEGTILLDSDDEATVIDSMELSDEDEPNSSDQVEPPIHSPPMIWPCSPPSTVDGDFERSASEPEESSEPSPLRKKRFRRDSSSDRDSAHQTEISSCLKNIHQRHCASNVHYLTRCLLCPSKVNKTNIVSHYVNDHPDREVFISRPSPKMVERLLSTRSPRALVRSDKSKRIEFTHFCYFCEGDLTKTSHIWERHLSTHTGEFMFCCRTCNKYFSRASTHCCPKNILEKTANDFSSTQGKRINCYLCKCCNFLQMNEANLIRHLQNEHEIEADLKSHYVEVVLLPERVLYKPGRPKKKLRN